MSLAERPASLRAFLQGSIVFWSKSSTNSSSLALVSFTFKCLGPDWSAVIKGKFTSVWVELDSSIFAFSAASFKRCNANLSFFKSIPCSFLNSLAKKSIILKSKSSPPKCVSPFVDLTSNTPSPTSKIDTSNVPPPKS